MKKRFRTLCLLFMTGIMLSHAVCISASELPSSEPPARYVVDNVPKLLNCIKKSTNVTFKGFLENARSQEELLVVKSNDVFKLTQLYIDEENAMNYVFERNQLQIIIRVFLPDDPVYANMDEYIAQSNEEMAAKYEGAQFTEESVTINEKEVKLYYIDGGTYEAKDDGEALHIYANAFFKVDEYPIHVVMSTTGSANYSMDWSSSDLEMFDFVFVKEIESGDVNNNGKIEADDALSILRDCVKIQNLPEEHFINADVNGDSVVDSEDALLVLQHTVKLIKKFPVQEF